MSSSERARLVAPDSGKNVSARFLMRACAASVQLACAIPTIADDSVRHTDTRYGDSLNGASSDRRTRARALAIGTPLGASTRAVPIRATKPIEDIAIGDVVWAWDESRGKLVKRNVSRLFRHADRPVIRIICIDDRGEFEVIEATPDHPFWVPGKGWTACHRLQPGDGLKAIFEKSALRVHAVDSRQSLSNVFNFEVTEAHNYFVGRLGALVHNQSTMGSRDPLFDDNGYLKILKDGWVSKAQAEEEIQDVFREYPSLAEHPEGRLMHASSSASLLAITQKTGGLIPTGEMIRRGIPPMSGELLGGLTGPNIDGLSTVFVTNMETVEKYAVDVPERQGPWSPERGALNLAKIRAEQANPDSFYGRAHTERIQIEEMRTAFWESLSPQEQGLVQDNFPVAWRIKPGETRTVEAVPSSDVRREMKVVGGASWDEVSELRVPRDRVESIQSLLTEHDLDIPVRPIEDILVSIRWPPVGGRGPAQPPRSLSTSAVGVASAL